MKRLSKIRAGSLLPVVLVVLAVAGYNYWAFCCGRCSIRTFLTVGPPSFVLFGLTVVAALTLLALRLGRRGRLDRDRCRCGAVLASAWNYCPDCGGGVASP